MLPRRPGTSKIGAAKTGASRSAARKAGSKGKATAERILDVAETAFARHGYRGASLREIATQAGLKQPGLYNHFASKEALYSAVLQRALQPLVDLMNEYLAQAELAPTAELPSQMTDLLARHPNISLLLIQALLSSDSGVGREAVLGWFETMLLQGRLLNLRINPHRSEAEIFLMQIAFLNLTNGFFWAAPLTARVFGADPRDPALLATQKHMLERVMATLAPQVPEAAAAKLHFEPERIPPRSARRRQG